MRDPKTHGTSPGARRGVLAALLLAGAAAVLAAGCTSDSPSEVGDGLVTTTFDTTLVPLAVDNLPHFGAVEIEDPDVPLGNQQLLYLGSRNGNRSSILVNFDFTQLDTAGIPPEYMHPDSIKTVRLSLARANYYAVPETNLVGATVSEVPTVWYEVHQLDAPFDSTAYPAPVPAFDPFNLNRDYVADTSREPRLEIDKDDFWNWFSSGARIGFVISAGGAADTTLVGYGSRDLLKVSHFDSLAVGTIVAPSFLVDFKTNQVAQLAPYADMSTFDTVVPVAEDPTDGIVLRTGLRNYPALLFDFSELPENVYVNRAALRLVNDPRMAFGPWEALVVSELDSLEFAVPGSGLTLDELDAATYQVVGIPGLAPSYVDTLEFNVTQYVQRRINGVYEGTRGLVLTAGEDFFPLYDQGVTDPDFYFSEFHFHGTAAAAGLRPELRITYSILGDLEGGAP